VERRSRGFSFMGNYDDLLSLGVPLYSGEGGALYPLPKKPRAAVREGSRAVAVAWGAARPAPKP
jgi:hypothetical protein